ncbi:MAG: adenylate/guanylate cyclase domain-containing protein [Pseudolysinimonas sp.]
MTHDATGDQRTARARRNRTLSIKSLILLMLLAVSIGSNLVVGIIGYVNGTDSLKAAAFDRLVEVRDSRSREITSLFESIQSSLLLASRDSAVVDAEQSFSSAFNELDAAAAARTASTPSTPSTPTVVASTPNVLSDDQEAQLQSYFTDDFGPKLQKATGKTADASSFLPSDPAARYLLYHYALAKDPTGIGDAGDGSAWSAASAKFHDYLSRMATLLKFGDVALIDPNGRVVYTVGKHVDLGASLTSGPYSFTSLATGFDQAMSQNRLDSVVFTDFTPYAPALDSPTAWVVAPLAGADNIVGAIAVQLPASRIDEVMTGGLSWQKSGLGTTGETYLVGDDGYMRSLSRDLAENPRAYLKEAMASGLTKQQASQAVASKESLGIQPVKTEAVKRAQQGKTGTITTNGYLGGSTVAAYAPLNLPDPNLRWVIVAEIDTDEALGPVNDFTARLAISAAIIVAIVSIISVIIAGAAVRPLRRLRDAARRIAAGESGVQVVPGGSDELADVESAFNDMSRSLELRAQLIEQQKAENEQLLQTLMPDTLAKRYKEGAKTIVEDHQEVTVLFADIVGFEDYSATLGSSEKALETLNDIFRAFDDAADEHGVERVRSTRQGYLASCGLVVPRVDNARRAVMFAIDMQQIVEHFGAQQGVKLAIRAGIDTGTVSSGLVGRSKVVYDLWGDAVSLAFRLQGGASQAGVFVTQRVVDKIADQLPFADSGVVVTPSGTQRVWRIDPTAIDNEQASTTSPEAAPL